MNCGNLKGLCWCIQSSVLALVVKLFDNSDVVNNSAVKKMLSYALTEINSEKNRYRAGQILA